MAVSDDLRSIGELLDGLTPSDPHLLTLLKDNLASLAEQVEALEELPFAPSPMSMPVDMLNAGHATSSRVSLQ